MKQLAMYTAVALATLAGVLLLWEFRVAIILFILSLAIAATLRPVVDFLNAHKLPRGLALILTYLGVIALLALLIYFLGGPVLSELQAIIKGLPGAYERLRANLLAGSWLGKTFAGSLPDANNLFQAAPGSQWNTIIQNLLGFTLVSLDLLSKVLIVFVLSIYWSLDQEHFKRLWLSLLPSGSRARWRDLWQNVEVEIGSYLRSEIIQSFLTLLLLAVGYELIGLRFPILLAIFGAIGWLIVWFGGLIAVIPALLIGLTINSATGLMALAYTVVVLGFLEFMVEPRFYNRQHLSSLLVVIMVLIMVSEIGIMGFFVAPPLAAAIQITANQLLRPAPPLSTVIEPPPPTQIEILRERLGSVQKMVSERPEPTPPEITNLIDRLKDLINRTNQEEQFTE